MNHNPKFTFTPNQEDNTLTISRDFAASKQRVWDHYTHRDLLEKWFAPPPLTAKTKHLDFSDGGYWLYAMVEPSGKEHWGRTDLIEVKPVEYYTAMDGFCDENGTLNTLLPRANWKVNFAENDGITTVTSLVKYESTEHLDMVIKMGMQMGMALTMDNLDEVLQNT